jgi:hypothetical protein
MSKKTTSLLSSATLLALAVGLFLLLSGVQTLIDFNSPIAKAARGLGGLFGADQTSNVLTIVIAVLKIASGAVLLVGPFGLLTVGIQKLAFWVIVGFWGVVTLWMAYNGILQVRGNQSTVMQWLQNLSLNVAILAALWQLKPAK